jgi:phage/plasmid-like protein (TIGR03299 family)
MKTIEEKCFDLLEETRLNWSVEKKPLITVEGLTTESHGIFRMDSTSWLGTVGNGYEPLQNSTLAMILLNAVEGLNIDITRGGFLHSGKKVYLQAQLPDEVIGNSNVNRWVTALNSHDGSTRIGFGSSNTVVICQNTFFKAFGEIQKFRHTGTMKERVELAQLEMRKTIDMDQRLMISYKRMADLPLNDEVIEKTIVELFDIDPKADQKAISTQKLTKISNFTESLQTSVNEHGTTVWALFNGITRYANHITAPEDITKQMDHVMLMGGMEFMNKGYELLNAYTNEQTPKQTYLQANN